MQEKPWQISPNFKLRDHRKQRHWTQEDVAEALGVIDLTVRRWEQGQHRPSKYYVKKLCDLFEKTPEDLGFTQFFSQPDSFHKRYLKS